MPDDITDEIVDLMWEELEKAHRCAIAHRALTPETFRISFSNDGPQAWIIGWESGDVASSVLARRMDQVQMVSLIAARIGATRALASANRALDPEGVAALGPLLQVPAVPKQTSL